jgi:carbon monoxide dehydrogenase subunit G
MTIIETEVVEIKKSDEEVFHFLSDFNNYEKLFPEEKIKNWKSDEGNCSFLIKGMSVIEMAIQNRSQFDTITIKSGLKSPFKFNIEIKIEASKEIECLTAIQLTFTADINAFMKMMVEKPLRNFFNDMVKSVPSQL